MWAEEGNASGRYKQTQEKSPERMAFNTSEGPGPCGDSYTESTSKALLPWGLRELTSMWCFWLVLLPKSLSSEEAGGRGVLFPGSLSPPRCWDPTQEKNVYLKTDSSKGVGAGDPNGAASGFLFQSSAPGKGDPSACNRVECLLQPLPSQQAEGGLFLGPWSGQQRWQTLIIAGGQRLNSRD